MSEVAPPSEQSYAQLDKGLAELQELKRSNGQLQKVLQLANALAGRALNTRKEVSSRTS